jgi:G:T-mismatch repair DNA endonuclease (very short patch repair protein)/endogenous inhibitor of DNA gyrase (YacG/DUF329 family)
MIIRPCEICGNPMRLSPNQEQRKRFCSKACQSQSTKKIAVSCAVCGNLFQKYPSRETKYCSPHCKITGMIKTNTGSTRSSVIDQCGYCGRQIKRYKSRIQAYQNGFCSNECYHAWDSKYKQTPAMRRKLALRMIAQGSKPSGPEQRVAEWLRSNGIEFEQQVKVHYSIIDFKVGDTLIEVNGCYWHACAEHHPMITPAQQKRVRRDKTLATYCRKRGIPLLVIWEHDIKRNDFSALSVLL